MIFMSVFLQFFGSPFLKSTFLFWGLMFGCFVAGISTYEGKGSVWDSYEQTFSFSKPDDKVIACEVHMKQGRQYNYFNDYRIRNAPWFTFLWAETFPLGFAPEYFLPILIGFFVSTAETIGDVTMSCKYSKLELSRRAASMARRKGSYGDFGRGAPDLKRVQGGLLADGVNSFLACLFTSPPNTTFSQNNGVIALTQCCCRGPRLLVRVLVDSLRCLWQIRSGVQLHSYLCGRGPRAPVLQSPTVSVTSHVGRVARCSQ